MSGRRKFSAEFTVEAAHHVIDSGRAVSEVDRELTFSDMSLGRWVHDEHAQMEAWMWNRVGTIDGCSADRTHAVT